MSTEQTQTYATPAQSTISTSPTRRRAGTLRGVALAAGALALFGVSVASVALPLANRLAPPAPVIGTINLEEAIKNLDERGIRENELKTFSESLQGELDKVVAELKDLDTKMKVLDGQQRKDAAVRVLELQATAEAKKKISEARIDQRRGEVFRALYDKITDTTKRMAEKGGYSMIIANDQNVTIPQGPSADIERTISLKRFLFVAPAHDVTSELVSMMNNEFKAGVGASAPMPAKP